MIWDKSCVSYKERKSERNKLEKSTKVVVKLYGGNEVKWDTKRPSELSLRNPKEKKKKNDPSNPYYIFDQRGVVETPTPPLSRIVKTFIRQE